MQKATSLYGRSQASLDCRFWGVDWAHNTGGVMKWQEQEELVEKYVLKPFDRHKIRTTRFCAVRSPALNNLNDGTVFWRLAVIQMVHFLRPSDHSTSLVEQEKRGILFSENNLFSYDVILFHWLALTVLYIAWNVTHALMYTGCPRRNVPDFGRVFLMLNYTDITQNTYIQSWTITEIMAIEKCGLLGCPHTVCRPWRHTRPQRVPGNETS
jgi:hypothetical protein